MAQMHGCTDMHGCADIAAQTVWGHARCVLLSNQQNLVKW